MAKREELIINKKTTTSFLFKRETGMRMISMM